MTPRSKSRSGSDSQLDTLADTYQDDILGNHHSIFTIEWDQIHIYSLGYPRAARRIPVEIIYHIMSFSPKEDLRSFSLLSKAFAAHSRTLLFSDLSLTSHFAKLSRMLDHSPHIAEHVKGLSVVAIPNYNVTETCLTSILRRLTHLTEVQFHITFYPSLLPAQGVTASAVQILKLHHIDIEDPSTLLSMLATMPCLRELHITLNRTASIPLGITMPHPNAEPFPALHTLDLHVGLCGWLRHAVSPSHIWHVILGMTRYRDPLPGLSLLEVLRGSLETITITGTGIGSYMHMYAEQDIYALLTEEATPRLRHLNIETTVCDDSDTFEMVTNKLPSAEVHARSLTVGLRVWIFTLDDFELLYMHLSGLSRTGLRWATFDLYCWGGHVTRLETYHLARRMRDYELMYAMIGMLGARPCSAPSRQYIPPRLQSERAQLTWWNFPTEGAAYNT